MSLLLTFNDPIQPYLNMLNEIWDTV